MQHTFLEVNKDYLVFGSNENASAIWLPILVCFTLVIVASFGLMPGLVVAVRVIVVIGFQAKVDFPMVLERFVGARYVLFDHGVEVFKEHFYIDRLLLKDASHAVVTANTNFFVATQLKQLKLHFLALLRKDLDFVL
jgi:hypothetical protein